jgi:alkylation response protein AidB-like acyl-CoA dehydrogenase
VAQEKGMSFQLTEAQRELQARARQLAQEVIAPRAAGIDQSEEYPWDNVAALKEAGFLGMTIPRAYGGQGFGYLEAVLVIEELAKACGVTARIAVETNMGALGAVLAYGTEAQKRLAADLVLGGDKPAICISEPSASPSRRPAARRPR